MGLNMCIEERKRQCKYLDMNNDFGSKCKKIDDDKNFDIKTFQSCVYYRKNNVKVAKKKIKNYEKKIKKLRYMIDKSKE